MTDAAPAIFIAHRGIVLRRRHPAIALRLYGGECRSHPVADGVLRRRRGDGSAARRILPGDLAGRHAAPRAHRRDAWIYRLVASGSVLFAAEASHIVLNPLFRIKLILILLGLTNVGLFEYAVAASRAGSSAEARRCRPPRASSAFPRLRSGSGRGERTADCVFLKASTESTLSPRPADGDPVHPQASADRRRPARPGRSCRRCRRRGRARDRCRSSRCDAGRSGHCRSASRPSPARRSCRSRSCRPRCTGNTYLPEVMST